MTRIFKLVKWCFVLALLLVVTLVLARNVVARKAIEIGAKQVTGFPLTVESVKIGWGMMALANLKMTNPPEFPERAFVDLPQFSMDYKTMSLLLLKPHIRELNIKLNEVVLVTNDKGENNVTRLTAATKSSDAGQQAGQRKKMPYRVDLVKVQVGTVRFVDHSKGKPTERKMVLNLTTEYRDITESTDLTALVLGTVLGNVRIPELKGVTDSLANTGDGLLGIFKKK
jgi:uncharacterized protein involved in outer membrane biogenesis